MKKIVTFLFFLLAMSTVGKAQLVQPKLTASIFGELSTDKNSSGHNYGGEGSFKIGSDAFSAGLYANLLSIYTVTGTGDEKALKYYYEEFSKSLGISIDSWKEGLPLDRYFWLNLAYRWSSDHGSDGLYEARQKDGLVFFSGGLKLIRPYEGWCDTWLIMAEYQTPLNSSITALYKGDTIKNAEPFNKERLRINMEIGIKKIPAYIVLSEFYFQPNLLLGFGWERSFNRKYGEVGVGFSFGENRDYYRELVKIKVFKRFGISHGYETNGTSSPYLSSWQIGASINLNWKMGNKQH